MSGVPSPRQAGGTLISAECTPTNKCGQASCAYCPDEDPPRRENSIKAKILTRDQLRWLPSARPLIKGVLDLDSESWLIGESGGYKSFVAIDWACHVATGRTWRGCRTIKGPVLYVAAEGAKSLNKRIDAWERKYGQVEDLYVLPLPVQAKGASPFGDIHLSREWLDLIEAAAEMTPVPVLIVLDTQARMTLGLKENDNSEMGVWVHAVGELKRATRACVLVVHHCGRDGGDARGASAIDAAQDWEWKMERVGSRKELKGRLSCHKNKDGDDTTRYEFHMEVITLGVDEDGDDITSLVLGDPVAADSASDFLVAEHLAALADKMGVHRGAGRDALRAALPDQKHAKSVWGEVARIRKSR